MLNLRFLPYCQSPQVPSGTAAEQNTALDPVRVHHKDYFLHITLGTENLHIPIIPALRRQLRVTATISRHASAVLGECLTMQMNKPKSPKQGEMGKVRNGPGFLESSY